MSLADIFSARTAVLPPSATVNAQSTSPRGTKRSRSPETYGDLPAGPEGDDAGMLNIMSSFLCLGDRALYLMTAACGRECGNAD